MRMADIIKQRLEQALSPRHLEIINESARHAGHSGDDGSGESHFKLIIESEAFAGLGRVASHKRIYEALGKDVMSCIHALSIQASAPKTTD